MATSKDAPAPVKSDDFVSIVVKAFKLINESWEALKLNLVTFIVLALVPAVLFAAAIPFLLLPAITNGGTGSIIIMLIGLLALFVVGCIFLPAITITQIESAKGNTIDFAAVFEKSKPLVLPFIGLALLSVLAIGVGLVLFIIPGLVLAFFLTFSAFILVDKKLGIIESMKASFELVKVNWEWVVALFAVQFAISLVSYFPIVGWLAGIVLSVAYFCLPAIVYIKINKK
jgi:hypothetical protein